MDGRRSYFGDRTAELLGRLSLNPLRHIDPIGTVLVPGGFFWRSDFRCSAGRNPFRWKRAVLRNPRRMSIMVALAGPAANILMAALWGAVLAAVLQHQTRSDLGQLGALMAQAGIMINVVLAVFNLLPIPPLDGGRVLVGLLPRVWGRGSRKIAPAGMFIVLGLSVLGMLGWLFDPAYRVVGQLIHVLGIGSPA